MVLKRLQSADCIRENVYRPEIDGLRAVAVVSIILFHLDLQMFQGGFVGVDIFFVISGFLITGLLKQELDVTGNINFKRFYLRRFRRLFPAFYATLIVTTLFAVVTLSPTALKKFGGGLASSLCSLSNVYFWFEADYFDVSSKCKPLLHTWSLGVEEQFYALWPIGLCLLYRLKSNKSIPLFLIAVFSLSLLSNVVFQDGSVGLIHIYSQVIAHWIADGKATIFFLLPFRLFEFAVGAFLVFVKVKMKPSSFLSDVIFCFGLGMICYSVCTYSEKILFPSFSALVPCLGTALLLLVGEASRFSCIVSNRVLVFVGLISYSLYLVHWPIVVFWSYLREGLAPIDQGGIVVLAIILAVLSYRYVEQPLRQRTIDVPAPLKVVTFSSVPLVVFLGVCLHTGGGWQWRSPATFNMENIQNAGEFHESYYGGAGYTSYGAVKTKEKADIVLMGDSHARHYAEGIYKEWAQPNGMALYLAAGTSCFHLPSFTRTTVGVDWDERCSQSFRYALDFIKNTDTPPIVVVSHAWLSQMRKADVLDENLQRRNLKIGPQEIIEGIRNLKKLIGRSQLVVIGQVPSSGSVNVFDVLTRPRFLFFTDFIPEKYLTTPKQEQHVLFNQRLAEAAAMTHEFIFLDPHDVLCENDTCRNTDSWNRPIYSDRAHLSKFGSVEVIRRFLEKYDIYKHKIDNENTSEKALSSFSHN